MGDFMAATEASIVTGLIGGALMGIGISFFYYYSGRLAGLSGIVWRAFKHNEFQSWALVYYIGVIAGAKIIFVMFPDKAIYELSGNTFTFVVGAFCIGVGSRIGFGCTSGHGICGIARLSKRSIVATAVFLSFAILTVYIRRTMGWL